MTTYLKKNDRKKQIKEAALKLFSYKGYRNTSVQDIVNKIGYSKGGFYNCYESKDELFKDILNDGMQYRFAELRRYKDKMKNIDRDSFLVEALLEKLFDENPYKKFFVSMIVEGYSDEELLEIHKKSMDILTNSFIEFCRQEGFEEYIKISSREFGIFINSLVLGVNVFGVSDNKEYRNMLRSMIQVYFKEQGLIK